VPKLKKLKKRKVTPKGSFFGERIGFGPKSEQVIQVIGDNIKRRGRFDNAIA